VLPDADCKLRLDASVEERARRRGRERQARGEEADYERVLASVRRRDEIDSSRDASPLRVADDAVTLDTTNLDIEAVLAEVGRLIEK
ncbi:MAG: cytidylate kinase, partial [Bradyrhizobium sp.]|nr:cytidylate kinase [Bradyrhizobium sp.]